LQHLRDSRYHTYEPESGNEHRKTRISIQNRIDDNQPAKITKNEKSDTSSLLNGFQNVGEFDINIVGEQIHWIKYKT